MRLRVRKTHAAVYAALLFPFTACPAVSSAPDQRPPADRFPTKPLRLVVPFPPGAATDALARVVGQRLSDGIAQPVIVDNRAGAGGTLGTDVVAKAPADGYTLLMAGTAHAINASLYSRLPYDPRRDFSPVTLVAFLPNALVVHPAIAARSVQQLIALAKARPGQLNYASGGSGSAAHLAMELFKSSAGVDIVHVPYKGGGQAMNDLLGGQVSMLFSSIYSVLPQVRAGKLRALGVASRNRSRVAPEWPTLAESGVPGYEVVAWYGVMAPAGVPRPVIARLNSEIVRSLGLPDAAERFADQGAELATSTPGQFGAHVRAEIDKWAAVVKATGARVD